MAGSTAITTVVKFVTF